jgi:signal transduction histidine kinase
MSLRVDVPPQLAGFFDPNMVQRIILNLLGNAFKFTPSQNGKIRISLSSGEGNALIEVQDNGIGIPASERAKIFQRFWQAQGSDKRDYSGSGTGLGLSITKEFVQLHNGTISIEDAPEGGSLFKIRLPLQAPKNSKIENRAYTETDRELVHLAINELQKPAAGKETEVLRLLNKKRSTILVVDDNEDINNFVASVLSDDYDVITAFNGQEGLQKTVLHRPDLVLTDIMMPKMSGHQMIQAIRKDPSLATTCIVVLTAKADDQLRVQLLNEGVQDYVIKPFYPEEILARVKNLISMKKTRESLQTDLETQVRDIEILAQEVSIRRKELQNAVKARDEFLSIASHELKTPLTSLKLQLQVARRGMKKAVSVESINETLASSLKQVDSLSSLVDELLDVTRIQSGKLNLSFESMDLCLLVREVVQHFSEELKAADITVELDLLQDCVGKWDQSRLEQVLVNLVSNAIKYAPGSHLKIAMRRTDSRIVLTVHDNGPGIEKEKQERLFERFERASSSRHVSGLGLGLFIAKNLVEAHGGTIKLTSDVGMGTEFVIELPVEIQQQAI